MKKLVRKLALSCAALAVCAATLVSSTFAWYTTNTEVSASGANATASASGDASIFISADAEDNKEWAQDITVDFSQADLLPVAWDGTKWVDKAGDEDSTAVVLTFTLYFRTAKTDEDVDLYFRNIVTTNLDADRTLEGTDNLLNGQTTSSGVSGATYSVDICQALGLVVNDVAYDISACNTKQPIAATNVTAAGNAHTYYNEVMGLPSGEEGQPGYVPAIATSDNLTTEIVLSGGNAIKVATLPAEGTAVAVEFNVFLNGWDTYCFDACKGQSFQIDLAFTSDDTTSFGTKA